MKKKNISSRQVFQQLPILKVLLKSKNSRLRKELLNTSPELIDAIVSICRNILEGNIPFKSKRVQNKYLVGLKKNLTAFASPKLSLAKKRKLLMQSKINQRGGFLPLLGALLPTITGLLGKLFN